MDEPAAPFRHLWWDASRPFWWIACLDRALWVVPYNEWAEFCEEILRQPQLSVDPRIKPNAQRLDNKEELTRIVERATSDLSSEELIARLDAVGITNARMRNMFEYDAHPQLKEQERWREVETSTGHLAKALLPPRLPVVLNPRWGKLPSTGEHTEAVFREFGIRP